MTSEEKAHTVITSKTITLRDNEGNELILGFDESFEKSVEYYKDDKDADLFYVGIKNVVKEDRDTQEQNIGLTVDQLRNLINTAEKLIRKLEEGE